MEVCDCQFSLTDVTCKNFSVVHGSPSGSSHSTNVEAFVISPSILIVRMSVTLVINKSSLRKEV